MSSHNHYDVIIIGTGAGGGTLAYKLAPSGKKILLLERGDYVPREKDNWSTRAVKFRVTPNKIVRVRVQLFAVNVAPSFLGVVLGVEVDGARAPVVFLARHVVATFEQKDLFTGGREFVGERAAARARADNDYVVVVVRCHDALRPYQ